jgi:hypothetical protein
MGRTIWWPMHGKSESKIGQQDRQDRVVQPYLVRVMLGVLNGNMGSCGAAFLLRTASCASGTGADVI